MRLVVVALIALTLAPMVTAQGLCDGGLPLPIGGFFDGWSCQEILDSMGTNMREPDGDSERVPDPTEPIPESYDWRDSFSQCVTAVRNQGKCGSCWAVSGAHVLGDRFCTVGQEQGFGPLVLGPSDWLNCDESCTGSGSSRRCQMGCDGGYQDLQWQWAESNGVASDSCRPYVAEKRTCSNSCADAGDTYTKYKAYDYYSLRSEQNIQRDIKKYGPVQGAMMVYEDFLEYDGGIYVKNSNKQAGGHAIAILGWGVQGGVKYWICRNSWGSSWGESGYFRIRRGTDEADIESYVYGARPAIDGVTYDEDDGEQGNAGSPSAAPLVWLAFAAVAAIISY